MVPATVVDPYDPFEITDGKSLLEHFMTSLCFNFARLSISVLVKPTVGSPFKIAIVAGSAYPQP